MDYHSQVAIGNSLQKWSQVMRDWHIQVGSLFTDFILYFGCWEALKHKNGTGLGPSEY